MRRNWDSGVGCNSSSVWGCIRAAERDSIQMCRRDIFVPTAHPVSAPSSTAKASSNTTNASSCAAPQPSDVIAKLTHDANATETADVLALVVMADPPRFSMARTKLWSASTANFSEISRNVVLLAAQTATRHIRNGAALLCFQHARFEILDAPNTKSRQ